MNKKHTPLSCEVVTIIIEDLSTTASLVSSLCRSLAECVGAVGTDEEGE